MPVVERWRENPAYVENNDLKNKVSPQTEIKKIHIYIVYNYMFEVLEVPRKYCGFM